MKKVIRCKKCGERVIYKPCGFIRNTDYICGLNRKKVDLDDGCTFGYEGEPMTTIFKVDIDISGDACV